MLIFLKFFKTPLKIQQSSSENTLRLSLKPSETYLESLKITVRSYINHPIIPLEILKSYWNFTKIPKKDPSTSFLEPLWNYQIIFWFNPLEQLGTFPKHSWYPMKLPQSLWNPVAYDSSKFSKSHSNSTSLAKVQKPFKIPRNSPETTSKPPENQKYHKTFLKLF